jgi:non-specific serine/threonine protein kinase
MDWSWELLAHPEQVMLRRLSVFAGGSTLEAAEAVCTGEGIEKSEVLGQLTRLVEKSLVIFGGRDGEAHYSLLETVRQYAREKLVGSGEMDHVQDRHLDFFLQLAELAAPELLGPQQALWLDRLEMEYGNLRAALAWCKSAERNAELGLQLANALWKFWSMRGYLDEGFAELETALTRTGEMRTPLRAKALNNMGNLASYRGDFTMACSLYEESLALLRELGDERGITVALRNLGNMAYAQGGYATARSHFEESLVRARKLRDEPIAAMVLSDLGNLARVQGDYAVAQSLYEQSLALARKLADETIIAWVLHNLGDTLRRQGDHAAARSFLVESLTLARQRGDKLNIVTSLVNLAGVAVLQEELERAVRIGSSAEVLRKTIGLALLPIQQAEYDRLAAAVRAKLGEEAFAAAWAQGQAMTLEQAIEYA